MKKVLLSLVVIAGFAGFVFYKKNSTQTTAPTSVSNSQTVGTTAAGWKDGAYTGAVADAFYGNLQVKATIANGKIADVQFLQYPHDRSTSIEINTQAMPILKSEAITAQSANVDVVSGATQTSGAFRETLQSALDQAK